MDRPLKIAVVSLAGNIAFASYYLIFGVVFNSAWLLSLGAYYLILSIVRFVVLRLKKKPRLATSFSGVMLMFLSLALICTVILSVIQDRGIKFHMIVMIAIAAYAFTKISVATVNLIRSRKSTAGAIMPLRSISFADALASIFALQRSMLVSFDGMNEAEIMIMNGALGSAVCITVFLLGLLLVFKTDAFNFP